MLEEHRQGLYITIIVIFVQCELTREEEPWVQADSLVLVELTLSSDSEQDT